MDELIFSHSLIYFDLISLKLNYFLSYKIFHSLHLFRYIFNKTVFRHGKSLKLKYPAPIGNYQYVPARKKNLAGAVIKFILQFHASRYSWDARRR